MSDDLTEEQLMAIWDDESGTPPPMTAAEMDRRLEAANERRALRVAALEERTRRLEALVAEKEALVRRLEEVWRDAQAQRARIDADIQRLLLTPSP